MDKAFVSMLLLDGAVKECPYCLAKCRHMLDEEDCPNKRGAWLQCSKCRNVHFVGEHALRWAVFGL